MNWLGIALMVAAFVPLALAIARLLERVRSDGRSAWRPGYLDLLSAGLFSAGVMILPERTAVPVIQSRLAPLALLVWGGTSVITLGLLMTGRFLAAAILAAVYTPARADDLDPRASDADSIESQ